MDYGAEVSFLNFGRLGSGLGHKVKVMFNVRVSGLCRFQCCVAQALLSASSFAACGSSVLMMEIGSNKRHITFSL